MNIYVAGQSKYFAVPELVMRLLEKDGHTITHDWSKEVREHYGAGKRLTDDLKEEIAVNDSDGVKTADAMVLVHQDGDAAGMHSELGICIGLDIPVIVFFPYQQKDFHNLVFYHHPVVKEFVYSYEELVEALNKLPEKKLTIHFIQNV